MKIRKRGLSEVGTVSISNALLLATIFLTVQGSIENVQKGTNFNYDVVACALGVGSMGGTGPIGDTFHFSCNNNDNNPDSPPP